MTRCISSLRILVPLLALAGVAIAAEGPVDLGKSSLTATFKQQNVPVESLFTKFSGRMSYDPAKPTAATAMLEVETASFDVGDEAYNQEVRKKSWFDSATYPKATFRSTSIKAGAAGKLDVTGQLTLKGKTQTVTVPVTVQIAGGATTFNGTFVISRRAFGLGDPLWNDVLEDKVTVKFKFVTATAAAPRK